MTKKGLPRGGTLWLSGAQCTGKTTAALLIVANIQRLGGVAAYVDVVHELDLSYARELGVDTANLIVSQPCADDALDIVEVLARSGEMDAIVLDRTSALTPLSDHFIAKWQLDHIQRISEICRRTNTNLIIVKATRGERTPSIQEMNE